MSETSGIYKNTHTDVHYVINLRTKLYENNCKTVILEKSRARASRSDIEKSGDTHGGATCWMKPIIKRHKPNLHINIKITLTHRFYINNDFIFSPHTER